MTGSAEREVQALESLPTLLSGAVADAVRAAGGFAGGIYLRSSTPGLLRMAVLAGLPGQLFRPWWRMHVDLPFPVADVHRLGEEVLLADATETMTLSAAGGRAALPVRFPVRPRGGRVDVLRGADGAASFGLGRHRGTAGP